MNSFDTFTKDQINQMINLTETGNVYQPDYILVKPEQWEELKEKLDDYVPEFENKWGMLGALSGIQVLKYITSQDVDDIIERFIKLNDRLPKIIIIKETP